MKKFWKNWALREVEGGHEPKDFWFDILSYFILAIFLLMIAFLFGLI